MKGGKTTIRFWSENEDKNLRIEIYIVRTFYRIIARADRTAHYVNAMPESAVQPGFIINL